MRFVFDLDGTICFDGKTIAIPIQEALLELKQQGHQLIFASARSYRDCLPVLGELFAKECVIGLNGGLIYDRGKLVSYKALDLTGFERALSFCRTHDLPYLVDSTFDYSSQHFEQLPFAPFVDQFNLARHLTMAELTQPIKMVIEVGRYPELAATIQSDLKALNSIEVDYHQHEGCLYLNPCGVNKATTLLSLGEENFITFGNDQNDLALFEAASYSVQVGNFPALSALANQQVAAEPVAVAQKIKELIFSSIQ